MQHESELLEDLSNETVDSAARKARKLGFEQGFAQGFEQGLEKGRREAIIEMAKRLFQLGCSDETIRAATLLSAEDISKIKNGA